MKNAKQKNRRFKNVVGVIQNTKNFDIFLYF